jgi:hypothetical protein
MPMYNLAIEEIDESVKRPVVHNVIMDLMSLFGLDENVPVMFKGQAPQNTYENSDVNGRFVDGFNRFSAESWLSIDDYTEEENETALLSTPVQYIDNKAVFADKTLRIFLVPAYVNKRFTVSISLTGTEKQIERWRANIKRRTSQGVLNGIHSVKYHYPIPLKFMGFLVDAFDMREKVKGYGDHLGDWFKSCFIPTMDVIRSGNGTTPTFVIRETQQPIQGWFDFGTGAPKAEKDDEMSRWVLKFQYTFYMDVPETINLTTPLVIHNQLLAEQYLPKPVKMAQLDFIKQHGSYSQEAFNAFRFAASANEYVHSVTPGLSIPSFDDWIGEMPNVGYGAILRLLIRLDESDLHKVMNLNGLGEWELNPLCTAYMKATRNKLTQPYENVINIMLHRSDDLLDMKQLTVDENLFVRYGQELDLRKSYHLVVTMCTDPTMLSDAAIRDLGNNACFFKYWITCLYPNAPEIFGWDMTSCTVGSDKDTMIPDEIIKVIDKVIDGKLSDRSIWPLVGFFTIHAHKLKDYVPQV